MAGAEDARQRLDWRGLTIEPQWQVNLGDEAGNGTFEWHGVASERESAKEIAIADAKRAYRLAAEKSLLEGPEPDIFRVRLTGPSELAQSLQIWSNAWYHIAPGGRRVRTTWTADQALTAATAIWEALLARAQIEGGDDMGILIGSRSNDSFRDATIDADIGLIVLNPNRKWSLIGQFDVPQAVRDALMATSLAYHFAGGTPFHGVKAFNVPQSATLRAGLQGKLARRATDNRKTAVDFLEAIGLPDDAEALAAVL